MAILNNTGIRMGASGAGGSYEIEKSLRFNDDDSAYFSRSQADGNRKTYTISWWMKWSKTISNQRIFGTGTSSSQHSVMLDSADKFYLYYNSSGNSGEFTTARTFNDPAAWYHFVFAVDTTQATESNRMKLWVNGVQQTDLVSTTYPNQNVDMKWNYATDHYIGRYVSGYYFGGYMAELFMIDGTAYDASTFGETDEDTGQWIPKDCSADLTYGTNGCYLKFTGTDLGEDSSGEDHDWTANNFTVTDGSNPELVDTSTDVPLMSDDGANGRGNHCTLNPRECSSHLTLKQGNLYVRGASTNWGSVLGTFHMSSGKWYWEMDAHLAEDAAVSIAKQGCDLNWANGQITSDPDNDAWGIITSGQKQSKNTASSYGDSFGVGDIIGVAFDADNGALYFSKNGTWQNSGDPTSGSTATGAAFTGLTDGPYLPSFSHYGHGSIERSFYVNFGARSFVHTPPSGFKALNTYNLPDPAIPDPSKHFDISLTTGANALSTATGLTDGADLVWIKDRENTSNHLIFNRINDSGMDGTPHLRVNQAHSESTSGSYSAPSGESVSYVWNAGSTTASNSDGDVTSSVRANTTAGFSIVEFTVPTWNGGPRTVGHGLNAVPGWIMLKGTGQDASWYCYHKDLDASNPHDYYMRINENNGRDNLDDSWGTSAPNSTVFSDRQLGGGDGEEKIAFCWSEVEGYSKIGSWVGNGQTGANGRFVHCGFRPAWIMLKRRDAASWNWWLRDYKRDPYNPADARMQADTDNSDNQGDGYNIYSNGFQLTLSNGDYNASDEVYIFVAFAESPFKYSNAR